MKTCPGWPANYTLGPVRHELRHDDCAKELEVHYNMASCAQRQASKPKEELFTTG